MFRQPEGQQVIHVQDAPRAIGVFRVKVGAENVPVDAKENGTMADADGGGLAVAILWSDCDSQGPCELQPKNLRKNGSMKQVR